MNATLYKCYVSAGNKHYTFNEKHHRKNNIMFFSTCAKINKLCMFTCSGNKFLQPGSLYHSYPKCSGIWNPNSIVYLSYQVLILSFEQSLSKQDSARSLSLFVQTDPCSLIKKCIVHYLPSIFSTQYYRD